jgi:two-component system, LytTR family, response regulator
MNSPITHRQHTQFLTVNYKLKTRIPIHNIIMLEGFTNYTLIHLQDGRKKLYARTLSYFQKLLTNDHFIRVHRGFLVNAKFILRHDEERNKLFLENDIEVTISRRKKKNLLVA